MEVPADPKALAKALGTDMPQNEKAPKIKKDVIYLEIADAMLGRKGAWPKFKEQFHIIQDDAGVQLYLEEMDDLIVKRIDQERIQNAVMNYAIEECHYSDRIPHGLALLNSAGAKEVIAKWTCRKVPLFTPPLPMAEKSDRRLTYHRLPFDIPKIESDWQPITPIFDEMMSRTGNAKALMAWIGSLLDPAADLSQYVWIYGQGGEGKSTLGRFLSSVFGYAAMSTQPPAKDDRFWSGGLVGKRLVMFPDCENYIYPTTGQFKSLTGGDMQRVEDKHRSAVQVKINCKFLFLANEKPEIANSRADFRRAIFCHMQPFENEPDSNYERLLWKEAADILGKCLIEYKAVSGPNKAIPCNKEELEAIAENKEGQLLGIIYSTFRFDPVAKLKPWEIQRLLDWQNVRNRNDRLKILDLLVNKLGIIRKRERKDKLERNKFETNYIGVGAHPSLSKILDLVHE